MTDTNANASGLVTNLLNQIEAMLDAGITTTKELGEFLFAEAPQKNPSARINDWIKLRKREPAGEYALKMHQFCISKTIGITQGPKNQQAAYRKAFKAVKERRK